MQDRRGNARPTLGTRSGVTPPRERKPVEFLPSDRAEVARHGRKHELPSISRA